VDPDEGERRAWGTGSVYPTRDGKWRASVRLGRGADGRYLRKEWEFRSEAAAWAKLDEVNDRERRGLPIEERRVTVAAYVDEWLLAVKPSVRPATFAFYDSLARNHLGPIRHLPLRALQPSDLRRLIAVRLDEGYAARTVRGIIDVVRMVLHQAMGDGLIDRNVAELVQLPKLEQAEPQHFTAEQARRFLEVAKDDPLYSLYAVAIGTGLRRSELLGLSWRDIGVDMGNVAVRASKTSAGVRIVPLGAFAREALGLVERRPGPIWPYRPEYVTRHFRNLCAKAGVPYITLHGLRHTAASLMLDAGVPIEVIRTILGHTKVSMSEHYARPGDELRRDAVERLGRMVG